MLPHFCSLFRFRKSSDRSSSGQSGVKTLDDRLVSVAMSCRCKELAVWLLSPSPRNFAAYTKFNSSIQVLVPEAPGCPGIVSTPTKLKCSVSEYPAAEAAVVFLGNENLTTGLFHLHCTAETKKDPFAVPVTTALLLFSFQPINTEENERPAWTKQTDFWKVTPNQVLSTI